MLQTIIPKIPFIDKEKTLNYYTNLGFKLTADYEDYLILENTQLEIHFFHYPNLEKEKSDFMLYIRCSEIENLYQNLQNNQFEIHPNGPLETKPWGQKEFSLIDPNGTLLTFAESTNQN